MDKVIAEVIIGILTLSLLMIVIPMYRTNGEMVREMAEKADYNEKVREVLKPDIKNNDTVEGSDVIAAIRYYAHEENVQINVYSKTGKIVQYEASDYDEKDFLIERDQKFIAAMGKDGNVLKFYFFRKGV